MLKLSLEFHRKLTTNPKATIPFVNHRKYNKEIPIITSNRKEDIKYFESKSLFNRTNVNPVGPISIVYNLNLFYSKFNSH